MFRSAFAPLACCWALLTGVTAQSVASLAAQLGNSQALQGTSQAFPAFTVTVLTNETHALVAINASKTMSEIGYAAIGFGSQMNNADMVVVWPNSDATWTMSHRTAGGHQMPTDQGPAGSDLTAVSSLITNSSSSPFAMYAFLRPLAFSSAYTTTSSFKTLSRASGQQFVYAYSDSNPGSSSQKAAIVQHDQGSYGAFTMDLSKPVAADSAVQTSSQSEAQAPWSRRDSIIVLHALCGCLAWLIFAPAAVLIGRLGRNITGWFRMHQLIQGVLTFILTVAAVALGVAAVNESGGGATMDTHHILGFVILALLLVQLALGFVIHRLFQANRLKRPLRNVGHIVLGVLLIVLGYVQVFKGFGEYERTTPGYVVALAVISLVAFLVLYLFSVIKLVQTRREKGLSWSFAAFGLGRNSPVALGEKHAMDPFAQPPAPRSSPSLAKPMLERAASSNTGPLPISDIYSRSDWTTFNESESELPWQASAESRVSRPHYGGMAR